MAKLAKEVELMYIGGGIDTASPSLILYSRGITLR